MFDQFIAYGIAAAKETMKKFRQEDAYLQHFDTFGNTLKAYMELQEDEQELEGALEQLMVVSHKFMRFLRTTNNLKMVDPPISRGVESALFELVALLDEPLEACVPVYLEAEALETLSYSIWRQLKIDGKINYCSHCQANLFGRCKKHKVATSVSDLIYCKGCTGWLDKICITHGAESCMSGDEAF